ncbi:MAG: nucleotidyltransferase family protein [Simkaniaceae bacterium]|nr:nucleotidyltransferase family protein [Simkaniaceae bacterium]
MDAIILAGGLGTRLQKVVSDRPKPLALIKNTPFLDLLINKLKHLPKIVLAVGYKADQIVDYYSNQSTIAFSIESTPLGTGGAIKQALNQTSSEDVLVLNGDSFLDISLEDFFQYHSSKQADITLATVKVDDANRFGTLDLDPKNQRLVSFHEKSSKVGSGWINAGVYLLKRTLFEEFSNNSAFSFEHDMMPKLLNKEAFGYHCKGTFIDIGTEGSYKKAQNILEPFFL